MRGEWNSEVGMRNAEMGPAVVPNERDYGAASMLKVEKKKVGRRERKKLRRWEDEKVSR